MARRSGRLHVCLPTCKQADLEGGVTQGFWLGSGAPLSALRAQPPRSPSTTLGKRHSPSVPRFPSSIQLYTGHLSLVRGVDPWGCSYPRMVPGEPPPCLTPLAGATLVNPRRAQRCAQSGSLVTQPMLELQGRSQDRCSRERWPVERGDGLPGHAAGAQKQMWRCDVYG